MLTTGPVSGITLAADTAQTDPLFTATGETNGGGDTGSVLISPFIKPDTSSYVYYNHYSWLRTMEDLFGVAGTARGSTGSDTSATPRSRGLPRSVPTCSTMQGVQLRSGAGTAGYEAKGEPPKDRVVRLRDVRRVHRGRPAPAGHERRDPLGYDASRAFEPGSRRFRDCSSAGARRTARLPACGLRCGKPAVQACRSAARRRRGFERRRAKKTRSTVEVLASLHHDSDAHVRYGSIPAYLRNKQAPPPTRY